MKFQVASPTFLRSAMLLALPCSIFSLRMYFPICQRDFLMLIVSVANCSIEPWSKIGLNLLSQDSRSTVWLLSYVICALHTLLDMCSKNVGSLPLIFLPLPLPCGLDTLLRAGTSLSTH